MSYCPICHTPIRRDKLMCLAHWNLVPTEKKQAVNRAYKRYCEVADLENVMVMKRAQEVAILDVRGQLLG
jgi:hypothetical protein